MGRSQSRVGTLSQASSRRSSVSKREEQPGWRNEEKVEQKVERMLQYNSQPAMRKIRLAPLVEVIEPTPPLCRNAPIFGMTGIDDQDFDFDISDVSSSTSERTDYTKNDSNNKCSESGTFSC